MPEAFLKRLIVAHLNAVFDLTGTPKLIILKGEVHGASGLYRNQRGPTTLPIMPKALVALLYSGPSIHCHPRPPETFQK